MKMAIELTFENVYLVLMAALVTSHMSHSKLLRELTFEKVYRVLITRGGGLGSRPKNMYGETLGDGVEYHLMKPTPRR